MFKLMFLVICILAFKNILAFLHKRVSYLNKQDAPLVSEYIINYQAIK